MRIFIFVSIYEDLPLGKVRRLASHHSSKVLQQFSTLGTSGRHKTNLYRDLMTKLKHQGCCELSSIRLPLKSNGGKRMSAFWPVIAPHEIVDHIMKRGLGSMLLGKSDVDEFWKNFLAEPGFETLADLVAKAQQLNPDILDIPFRLHGDEGKFHNNKTVTIMSLGSLSHSDDPYMTRLLLAVVPSTRYSYTYRKVSTEGTKQKWRWLKVNETMKKLSEFLTWSFKACSTGKWPDQPFAWCLAWHGFLERCWTQGSHCLNVFSDQNCIDNSCCCAFCLCVAQMCRLLKTPAMHM